MVNSCTQALDPQTHTSYQLTSVTAPDSSGALLLLFAHNIERYLIGHLRGPKTQATYGGL